MDPNIAKTLQRVSWHTAAACNYHMASWLCCTQRQRPQ